MEKHRFFVKVKASILSGTLRFARLTWRAHLQGLEHLDRLYAENRHFLICFWHGKYTPIIPLLEGYPACIVSSQSERGSVIAEICSNFGYQSVQIPDQPRRDSLRLMEAMLSEVHAGGMAVDGPLGPRGRVKSGVIRLASALGLELLPLSLDSRPKKVYRERWDLMEIPLPFAEIRLVVGEPIKVPADIRPGQARIWTGRLAGALARLDEKAGSMVRSANAGTARTHGRP